MQHSPVVLPLFASLRPQIGIVADTSETDGPLSDYARAMGGSDAFIIYATPGGPVAAARRDTDLLVRHGLNTRDICQTSQRPVRLGGQRASDTIIVQTIALRAGNAAWVGYVCTSTCPDALGAFEHAIYVGRSLVAAALDNARRYAEADLELRSARYALDQCDVGIIHVSENALIRWSNATASSLLERNSGLRRAGTLLSTTDLRDAARLRVAIEYVAGDPGMPGARIPVLSIARRRPERPLFVAVRRNGDYSGVDQGGVGALLYIFDPDRDVSSRLGAACRLYGLSPVETLLATQLASGASLTEAAEVSRIKEQTARGYLKQIFAKTGVNRQSALVRVLLASVIRIADSADFEIV